jgi:fructosamine-3-kinase
MAESRPGKAVQVGNAGLVTAQLSAVGRAEELSPSPPGWADRMPILNLRELLSTVAHFGTRAVSTIQQIRQVLAPFR